MRFVPVSCIREGMIVGKQLLGRNGELLLNSGSIIHSSYISKIEELGYNGIYVNDDLSSDIEISEVISDALKNKAVKAIKDTFESMESGKKVSEENIEKIGDLVNEIVENILSSKCAMINMVDLKVFDDYTFYHSVNVSVLSIVIGNALSLNRNILYKLGLSAVLHDIGKVFIPKMILNKKSRLTDEEQETIQSHAYKGYEYLKEKFQIPAPSYVGILQHHERYDGTGYPNMAKDVQISLFGRIIAVADVYDALTSNRPYRKALTPSDAIEYIMGGGGTLFDPSIASRFTQVVAPYPVGSCVLLSNNKTGIVVENYSDCCIRPRIKIIKHQNEELEPYFIDLRNDKNARDVIITGMADM